jgi:hypothetical protein
MTDRRDYKAVRRVLQEDVLMSDAAEEHHLTDEKWFDSDDHGPTSSGAAGYGRAAARHGGPIQAKALMVSPGPASTGSIVPRPFDAMTGGARRRDPLAERLLWGVRHRQRRPAVRCAGERAKLVETDVDDAKAVI